MALTSFAPARAQDAVGDSTEDLTSTVRQVDGQVVSTLLDDDTGRPVTPDTELFGERPADGGRSGGAVMGQWAKTAEDVGTLSRASATTLEQLGGQAPARATAPEGHASAAASTWRPAGIQGMDVSYWQGTVNWSAEYANGARFAYVKATEGTYYRSLSFNAQYAGAQGAGMVRGAYHFAIPDYSSGAAQADYFVDNGGGWSADGRTLPGLLDIEYNPYGQTCYDKSPAQMIAWLGDFSDRYRARTGRLPMIYTTADWWRTCTGNTSAFNDHPLHLASYGVGAPLWYPNGWSTYDVWQYSDSGPFSGDSNVFRGTSAQLTDLARNAGYRPIGGTVPVLGAAGPFEDVPGSHPFAAQITWAKTTGVLKGWPDGTFRPANSINRDAMAAAVYRMAGSPSYTAPDVSEYEDVAPGRPFYKEIHWAREKGLLTGWPDGTFRPTAPITREATAALLHRYAGSPAVRLPAGSPYTDVATSRKFYREIAWLDATGLSTGWSDGTFRPTSTTARDAMAAFLNRYDVTF